MITWDEYKKNLSIRISSNGYEETNIECPNCGKPLYRDTRMVLATYPPQHRYDCLDCKWTGTAF